MDSFFKDVFVINRTIDKERMKITHDILSKNDINYKRFEAITINNNENNTNMTNEILGCGLSHMHIWDYIVSNDIKSAVIFEDDICLKKDWEKTLNIALKELPKDWDIFTLGNTGIKFKYDKYDSPFNFILYHIVNLLDLQNNNYDNQSYNNITTPYFFTGTYGYAISKKGARKLLNLIKNISFHIDAMISSHSKSLNIYSINNDIVYQRSEKSTLSVKSKQNKIHLNFFSKKDSKNVSYNYYMNIPVYKINIFNQDFIINGWFILALCLFCIILYLYNLR